MVLEEVTRMLIGIPILRFRIWWNCGMRIDRSVKWQAERYLPYTWHRSILNLGSQGVWNWIVDGDPKP